MIETFTKTLNTTINENKVKEAEVIENMEADELIFYNSLRTDLDLLQRKPSPASVELIMSYSQNIR